MCLHYRQTINNNPPSSILVVPAHEPGRGGGHRVRCIKLAEELRQFNIDVCLYDPATSKENLSDKDWKCIILDRFKTAPQELASWKKLSVVIGIDEGGPCRDSFDFLIDILPNLCSIAPNIFDPSLLPLPENKQKTLPAAGCPLKVLASFGQEDAAGLGSAVSKILAEKKGIELTVTKGNSIPNLSDHLHEYDLLITHYGITAFEALYAGTGVILVNPTKYHEKLSKAAGFFTSSVKNLKVNLPVDLPFVEKIKNRCKELSKRYNLDHEPNMSLAQFISGFSPNVSRNCRVCGSPLHTVSIARFSDRTYRRCSRCGIINMDRLTEQPVKYGKDYFFEQYRRQYGKTYLEDFPNLISVSKRRLKVIRQWAGGRGQGAVDSLLDIGCAYGAFLQAAKEEGYSPFGIDPCEEAVNFVQKELGIPALQANFPLPSNLLSITPYPLPLTHYSIITLWYVIEHFQDCVSALAQIKKILKPGGILAFSTPSFSGISGRSSQKRYLGKSPADHFTVWPTASCKKALRMAGFSIKRIINTGHHPERFPFLGKFAKNRKSPLYWLLLAISRIFSLGDTYEVYAVAIDIMSATV